jgi:polysaccharide biosynthesis transport protein
LVVVAVTAEEEIRAQLQAELAVALAAATKDVENSQARIQTLKLQLSQREERFAGLARMRALHDNLNNEVRARSRDLQETERQLAEARAARDAAMSSSLLTRLDEPVLGDHPIGPGRATICVGLSLAGWFLGLSLVFLLTPLGSDAPPGQRWNDSLGRRISDRFPWLAEPASGRSKTGRRRSDTDQRAGETALATVVGVNSLPAEAGTSSAMVNPGPVSLPQRPRRTSDRASSDQVSREQVASDRAASGQAATRPFAMPVVPIVEDSLWLPPADNPFMAPSGNAGVIPPITPNFRTPSW